MVALNGEVGSSWVVRKPSSVDEGVWLRGVGWMGGGVLLVRITLLFPLNLSLKARIQAQERRIIRSHPKLRIMIQIGVD
jgi:hypothetical protein